jgi:hypothetical protein
LPAERQETDEKIDQGPHPVQRCKGAQMSLGSFFDHAKSFEQADKNNEGDKKQLSKKNR